MRILSIACGPTVRHVVVCVMLAVFFVTARSQAGTVYSYGHIGDSPNGYAPAINNNGLVAFAGNNGVVFTGNGGALTTIGNGTGAVYAVWINDAGQVAFRNNPSLGVVNAVRGSGGPLTVIGSDIGVMPVISNDGTVTFMNGTFGLSGGFGSVGIFSGNGGALTTIMPTTSAISTEYSSEFEGLAASHNGIVAFEKYPSSSSTSGQQIIVNRSGAQTVVVTLPANGVTGIESLAVNNAGVVAIAAEGLNSDGTGIFLADGTTFTHVIPSSGAFYSLGVASINDLGQLAFPASYAPGNALFDGIYTGPDPLQDKVIQTGDALNGSTVTKLVFGNEGLSDSGEVVFWAQLANGTSGVYTATPVPEPGTLALSSFGVACVLLRRRRAR